MGSLIQQACGLKGYDILRIFQFLSYQHWEMTMYPKLTRVTAAMLLELSWNEEEEALKKVVWGLQQSEIYFGKLS